MWNGPVRLGGARRAAEATVIWCQIRRCSRAYPIFDGTGHRCEKFACWDPCCQWDRGDKSCSRRRWRAYPTTDTDSCD